MGTPTGSFSNPRLFSGDLILTGTLSGMQDPSMVLGVHGALVSGRIAAMAVNDRERATAEFRRMNRWWRLRLPDAAAALGHASLGSPDSSIPGC